MDTAMARRHVAHFQSVLAVDRLIAQSRICARCGKLMDEHCKCWPQVLMHCPKCQRSKMDLPDVTDPPGTYMIVATCDACDDHRFRIRYYDRRRREIT
ncbi:MAG TPA: hypothetical protein VFK30_08755 [Anaerolineae bacterium]|nr:hypothetical protein [Anaerolineae bacterium]